MNEWLSMFVLTRPRATAARTDDRDGAIASDVSPHADRSRLHTERVEVKNPKKDSKEKTYTFRAERTPLFHPSGSAGRRVVQSTFASSATITTRSCLKELIRLRRNCVARILQYVIDALVLRFNKDIAQRREQIKQLLNERQKAGAQVSPDVFLSVSRSLVTRLTRVTKR